MKYNKWIIKDNVLEPKSYNLSAIINVTPDSFFDGNTNFELNSALKHSLEMLEQGADILDIGAQSTRPTAQKIDADEELRRLVPVLTQLRKKAPQAIISIDSFFPKVLRKGLELGAHIINDVSGGDEEVFGLVKEFNCGYILMHGYGQDKKYDNVLDSMMNFFESKLNIMQKMGINLEQVVLDVGVGFGKTNQDSLVIMQNIEKFFEFNRPLYMGLSMKSFFGDICNVELEKRGELTRLATVLLAQKGVVYHRLHEIQKAKQVLDLYSLL